MTTKDKLKAVILKKKLEEVSGKKVVFQASKKVIGKTKNVTLKEGGSTIRDGQIARVEIDGDQLQHVIELITKTQKLILSQNPKAHDAIISNLSNLKSFFQNS